MNSFPVPDGQSCFRPRSSTAHLHGPVLVMGTSWHALLMEHTPWPQNFNAACSTVPQFQRQKHKRRSPLACLTPHPCAAASRVAVHTHSNPRRPPLARPFRLSRCNTLVADLRMRICPAARSRPGLQFTLAAGAWRCGPSIRSLLHTSHAYPSAGQTRHPLQLWLQVRLWERNSR